MHDFVVAELQTVDWQSTKDTRQSVSTNAPRKSRGKRVSRNAHKAAFVEHLSQRVHNERWKFCSHTVENRTALRAIHQIVDCDGRTRCPISRHGQRLELRLVSHHNRLRTRPTFQLSKSVSDQLARHKTQESTNKILTDCVLQFKKKHIRPLRRNATSDNQAITKQFRQNPIEKFLKNYFQGESRVKIVICSLYKA